MIAPSYNLSNNKVAFDNNKFLLAQIFKITTGSWTDLNDNEPSTKRIASLMQRKA